ncbi:MAG: polysaccharide deacetylase family protein, partial [Acidobacteriaceae bacterium]|nr:polysaccharide deacetylase family protein [Acidobacteriaceae bacterium]
LPILAEINNYRDGWQPGDLHKVLNHHDARENLIDNIVSNIEEHKFAGVNIDFEQLPARDKAQMVAFMQELSARLKPLGLLLTQDVPTDDDGSYDLKRLAEVNDFVVPMVYDEHYQSGTPGPVASEAWFQNQLELLLKELPPQKTVIGFGNYGYDWIIGSRKGGVETSYGDVIAAAVANKAPIVFDKDTDNPVLRYSHGKDQHEVWFLDAVTALNHIIDVSDSGFRGIGLWRLGAEDPGLWATLPQMKWPTEDFAASTLFHLTAQKSVQHYGQGEVLRIVDQPRDGARNVWKDKDGNFVETYQSLPSYYVVEHSGGAGGKLMTITFDDGPSEYTGRVLDILKNKQAPATFFVIGENAEQYAGEVRREYAEGHTIGNHTYTHPNVAKESAEETMLELNTTLRLIEHDTGHSSILFRPPYNADSEPQTPAELLPILRAQQLGYVTVGEKIDPRDWEIGTTPAKILEQVLEQKDDGHMILLHDGGGDRSATLAALPQIIDTLRAQGYQFVPLEQLIGRSRAQLMPVPGQEEQRWASIEGDALITKGNFKKIIGVLFIAAIVVTVLRSLVFSVLAIAQKRKAAKRTFDPAYRPGVSVVIAAYNEEKVVRRTVQSILDNGYPDLEVVVVNDGSKDHTLEVLHNAFDHDPRVRIFTQSNLGKADALNHAIREAKHPILVAL